MSLPIETLGFLLQLVALVSVPVGLIQYVLKSRSEEETRRSAQVEKWREAAAYEIFRKAEREGEEAILFEDFVSEMKKSGFEAAGLRIRREELNERNANLLLVSMIEKKLIEPLGSDRYMLRIDGRNIESRGYSSVAKEPYPLVLETVKQYSGNLTEIELREALYQQGLDFHRRAFRLRQLLIELIGAGLIRVDESGRFHAIHEDSWAKMIAEASQKTAEIKIPGDEQETAQEGAKP